MVLVMADIYEEGSICNLWLTYTQSLCPCSPDQRNEKLSVQFISQYLTRFRFLVSKCFGHPYHCTVYLPH